MSSLRWVVGHSMNIHFGKEHYTWSPNAPELSGSGVKWLCDPGEAGPSQSHTHPSSGDSGVSIFFQYLHPGSQPSPKELQVWGRQSWTQMTSLLLFKRCEQNVELCSINQRHLYRA